MSLRAVAEMASALPPTLRDDVISYARSVQQALPDILKEASVTASRSLEDEVVFVAGLKKLHAICYRAFFLLETALDDLHQSKVDSIRMGSTTVYYRSPEWLRMEETLRDLEALLRQHNLSWVLTTKSHTEVVDWLANERRGG